MLQHDVSIDVHGQNRKTFLIRAIEANQIKVVQFLVKKGANVNEPDLYGMTALMCAAEKGYTDIVKLLVERGSHVNDIDLSKKTALMHAIERGNLGIIQFLIANERECADVKVADIHGITPLMYAVKKGDIRVVWLLIENNAMVDSLDKEECDALIYAIKCNDKKPEIAQLLIDKMKEKDILDNIMSRRNKRGETALMIAINYSSEVAKLLLKQGNNINADINGISVLQHVINNNLHTLAEFIIDNGADTGAVRANIDAIINGDGRTMLY